MSDGVVTELTELIALRRYAYSANYTPERRAVRSGNHLSKLRGRGMDFAEVRNYQAGDEVRHMEWRVTARTGRPHVKLFQEERERPAIILADFSPSMYFGTRVAFKSAVAARLAAILAWTAVNQGDRLGGLLFSDKSHSEFIPRGREAGVLPFLASLSAYTKEAPHAIDRNALQHSLLNQALVRLRRVARPGSILVLISDFYLVDEETEQHLSRLRAHNDMLAYHVCDPLELSPPKPHQYAITNGREEILLDTTQQAVTTAYQTYCERRITELQALMKRNQIQYVQVTSEMDLPYLVRTTYPRRSTHG
ncbi:DUF58 domain-containing protein [Legionella impletisoli]|uniref:DUF58 domain-containing protein n=1 Tax=Legionella impletisoli TaxID=343510 RepID=A0A917NB41_9GAMM|nr:DUF58 domain-containing protein [Legionella impletisoli]GGI84743.1 hypothetical protein GCM10007966_11660 [Legionella impletisoli]